MRFFNRTIAVDIGELGGDGFRVSDLFVKFKVVKTRSRVANKIELEIANLAKTTRDQIRELDDFVVIRAGYGDLADLPIMTVGQVTLVNNQRLPPDTITRIEAMDGIATTRNKRDSFSFRPGASVQQVLDDIVGRIGLAERTYNVQAEGTYPTGFAFSGRVTEALQKAVQKSGLEWSIQNNEIQIIDANGSYGAPAVLVSPSSGLIGSPRKKTEIKGRLINTRANRGYTLKSLLNPTIEPGALIRIESAEVEGNFRVDTITHTGDNRGQDWFSDIEVTALNG